MLPAHNCSVMQNENVGRGYTSQRKVHAQRPDRRTEMKVLVEKKYDFVEKLWASYVAKNRTQLQCYPEIMEVKKWLIYVIMHVDH